MCKNMFVCVHVFIHVYWWCWHLRRVRCEVVPTSRSCRRRQGPQTQLRPAHRLRELKVIDYLEMIGYCYYFLLLKVGCRAISDADLISLINSIMILIGWGSKPTLKIQYQQQPHCEYIE